MQRNLRWLLPVLCFGLLFVACTWDRPGNCVFVYYGHAKWRPNAFRVSIARDCEQSLDGFRRSGFPYFGIRSSRVHFLVLPEAEELRTGTCGAPRATVTLDFDLYSGGFVRRCQKVTHDSSTAIPIKGDNSHLESFCSMICPNALKQSWADEWSINNISKNRHNRRFNLGDSLVQCAVRRQSSRNYRHEVYSNNPNPKYAGLREQDVVGDLPDLASGPGIFPLSGHELCIGSENSAIWCPDNSNSGGPNASLH